MKYYETTFEEYLYQVQQYNYHPELTDKLQTVDTKKDILFYGSSGSGKYSQLLTLLQNHSPSKLHYYKKITVTIEQSGNKTPYSIIMSDIHFEIDMSILGCNSKKIWHEIFTQIVEIIKLRENHQGIIVCKNFHAVHSELLEIFYSYMQHYRYRPINLETSKINISFILMTEHLSFIPNDIIQSCMLINVKSPSKESLKIGLTIHSSIYSKRNTENQTAVQFQKRIQPIKKKEDSSDLHEKYLNKPFEKEMKMQELQVLNIKEYYCLSLLMDHDDYKLNNVNKMSKKKKKEIQQITDNIQFPKDIFNKVCTQLIEKINNIPEVKTTEWFASFRDDLYSILICQLDVAECVFYILEYFILSDTHFIKLESIQKIMSKMYPFFLYYNNNYRPIYHLEMIFLYLIHEIYGYS